MSQKTSDFKNYHRRRFRRLTRMPLKSVLISVNLCLKNYWKMIQCHKGNALYKKGNIRETLKSYQMAFELAPDISLRLKVWNCVSAP